MSELMEEHQENSEFYDSNENESQSKTFYNLFFDGDGIGYFGIWAVNVILTVLTFGLYYPWAKVAMRKYLWNETRIDDDRFVFHGEGKELFRGFIIVYGMLLALIILSAIFPFGMFFYFIALFLLMPYAIFGAWRYRFSRTSWRGIFFAFDGDMSEFAKLFYKNMFLSVITFGIYSFWMKINIMKYLFSHTRLGQYEFDFTGHGDEYFGINVVGSILSAITLYLYLPFFITKRFNFFVNNTIIRHENGVSRLDSILKGSEAFKVMFVNGLLIIFSLGLAFPWVMIRTIRLFVNSIDIPVEVDLENLKQDADDFKDATGDDLLDVLDIGFDI